MRDGELDFRLQTGDIGNNLVKTSRRSWGHRLDPQYLKKQCGPLEIYLTTLNFIFAIPGLNQNQELVNNKELGQYTRTYCESVTNSYVLEMIILSSTFTNLYSTQVL